MTALDEAVKVGAEMVEFDVQLTKDGVPIMIHDDNFKRTTGLDLNVFELNQKDLQNHIALKEVSSVEEVMVWLQGNPNVTAFVEIKQASILFHGLEKCIKALK
ncbi:MAG: glycerophosphodiester phosphodiesterase family protein, partial [Flavobacteriales bacterium]